jgi:hypothetical protein
MRYALLLLGLLVPVAVLGPLAGPASACTLNPATTFTVSNPALVTAYVGTGTGGSGACASAGYGLGYVFSCPASPASVTVGPYTVSVPPVTVTVNALASVSQGSLVCDKRVTVLP